jgi:hypothetical protein
MPLTCAYTDLAISNHCESIVEDRELLICIGERAGQRGVSDDLQGRFPKLIAGQHAPRSLYKTALTSRNEDRFRPSVHCG